MKLKELVEKYGDYDVGLIETPKGQESEWARVHLLKPKPKTVWELKDGDDYYLINSDGNISPCYKWIEYCCCDEREVGNVFLTKKEAEQDIERRKVEALLLKYGGRRWFKKGVKNHYLWATDTGTGLILGTTCDALQGAIYFDSKDKLTEAVEQIGTDRILKALFEVR